MPYSRLLTLGIALIAATATGADREASRLRAVIVPRLEVSAEPSEGAFVTAEVNKGDRVEVVKALPGGWLAIAPPDGAFLWVDDVDVDVTRAGRVVVKAATTTLHLGREGVDRPGPPRTTVAEGSVLIPVRRALMTYGFGRSRRVWRAVEVDKDDVQFVRADGVAGTTNGSIRPPAPERRASAEVDPADLPPEVVGPLREIEATRRSVVSGPIERWDLEPVRKGYQALLAKQTVPSAKAAVQDRLDRVDREAELAKSARAFEAIVRKSRGRDAIVAQAKATVHDLRVAEALAFDAEGLLQATAKRVDGEKVASLLGDDGQIVAYLKIPPGLDTTNLLARQVGVRGRSRFNESLRFRLLEVRQIEPLDADR